MKNPNRNIVNFLLFQVVLLTSAANSFAFSEPVLNLDSRQGEYFKSNQNNKGLIFEEINHDFSFQSQSEKDSDNCSLFLPGLFSEKTFFKCLPDEFFHEWYLDKKSILKNQIFPFHFFW